MWFVMAPRTGYSKGMSIKEIGLHAQTIIIILSSKVNIIGGTYMSSTRIFALEMIKICK